MDKTILIALNILLLIQLSYANWGTPGSSQYHIQTDEGPERFFRYQTDNGQFRKEKRLQDGTVIGTNAWIDGFGYLRQSDYIADHAGYRILKSKTVFVGKDRPIEDAMNEAKNKPANAGTLVPSNQSPSATFKPSIVVTTQRPVTTTYSYSTPGYYYPKAPTVFIRPNAHPEEKFLPPSNDLDQPAITIPSNDILIPSDIYLPPYEDTQAHSAIPSSTPAPGSESHLPPIAYYPESSSTDAPSVHYPSSTLAPPVNYPSSTVAPSVYYSSSTPAPSTRQGDESHLPPIAYYPSSTASPLESNSVVPLLSTPSPFSVKHLSNGLEPSNSYGVVPIQAKTRFAYRPTYQYSASSKRPIVDYNRNIIDSSSSYQSPSNVPLFDRSKYQQQQYPSYDGVGVTANGFRYFLPRQYQEEVSNNDGSRDGSFGYVDPFGIRRVVYYNAGKNGFIHRKNNRYVGFNSTPYDPRPN